MKTWLVLFVISMASMWSSFSFSAEKTTYPPPRFPSYLKPPKNIEDIMPYARAAVRQTGGRTPLGLVEKGTVLIVTDSTADATVMQAIKRAYEERGVKVQLVPEYDLVAVSAAEARKAKEATRDYTSEHGYMEAERWINSRFADPDVPKKWLKERRPDLYKALFEKETLIPPQLKATADKLTRKGLTDGLIKYLDNHPEVNAVFFRRGGRTATSRTLGQHAKKFFGNFIFDNRWEVMNKASTFPGDVWRLAEERIIEPLAWVDRVHAFDPEGTDFTFEVDEKQAQAWTKGSYQQGHLYMFPHQATGRFPYSTVDYPAFTKEYNPRYLIKVNGVFAGVSNHTGFFPRIEVRLKDGYVAEVKGGGVYGEVWREFLKYPKIHELTYPFHDGPGYWWIYEAGLGTNPKFFKRPDENMEGNNTSERNNAGVIHWGFGLRLHHGPDKAQESKEWMDFAAQHGLPNDHWWHIHNTLPTYRVRIRGTKNTWITVIDKGEITAYRAPEVRALASRYGDPKELLVDDWSPHLPGINAPGKYEDYAKDPWKTQVMVMKKIEASTYEYFYPAVKSVVKR